ncbi:Phosphoglycerate mutase [Catenulispora acidiphila DSM 44928]|uniref:Phosphoglycerate mutase n=1 Tax=Catenulispora acidiphila (strain DSM 44928 / JCM 14897 / NBRC 102108 / NRRL B-24433 / ID139908) TaxID=479433 RepID=C7Q9B6_CATAD|nr:histidine phosphatase family protein [Catenulispora acidiphila]ACU74262.1 Phosphoglycerate mutase [Catenulispora acidiphila DSM 44928]
MTLVLLIRHGRTTANSSGILAGWTKGVRLDERGEQQAGELAKRLAEVPLAAVVSSPLERCRQTSDIVLAGREGVPVHLDERIGECRYGDWTGRPLSELAQEPLWRVVQAHPSAARFPGPEGESLADMSARAVAAVREWNTLIAAEHGPEAVWALFSHGDVIKALAADALGLHLDQFQRITADPCSVTAVRYTELRPFVVRLNDVGGDPAPYKPAPERSPSADADAAVGGGAGADNA